MRSHHVIAIVAVLIIGFSVKVLFFSSPAAEAEVAGMDVFQIHLEYPNMKDLPVHEVKEPF
jgi:hypothetical protein